MPEYLPDQYVIVDNGNGQEVAVVSRSYPVFEVTILSRHKLGEDDLIYAARPVRHATRDEVNAAIRQWEANHNCGFNGEVASIGGIVYACDAATCDSPATSREIAVFVVADGRARRVHPEASFIATLGTAHRNGKDLPNALMVLADAGEQLLDPRSPTWQNAVGEG